MGARFRSSRTREQPPSTLDRVDCFADFLRHNAKEDYTELQRSEGTGRPMGAEDFVVGLEHVRGRKIARRSLRSKPKSKTPGVQPELL